MKHLMVLLRDEHPPALVLLVIISLLCVNALEVSLRTMEVLFGCALGLPPDGVRRAAFRQAVNVLVMHNLIGKIGQPCNINSLVQSIIHDANEGVWRMRSSSYMAIRCTGR